MAFVREVTNKSGTYLAKVKNVRENGKVKQKHLGMVGKVVNGKEIMYGDIHDSEITDVSTAGNVLILREIMQQLELDDILDIYTDSQGKWIAALILAHCTNPTSLNRMKKWCKRYGATDILDIHPKECSKDRFYRALDKLTPKSIVRIESALFERMRKFIKKKESLFYDVTTTYFYGTSCKIAKSGHNPQGNNLPQINIGLAVTKEYGFPIFHQVYDGNIQDAQSIYQALRSFRDFGIKDITLVWDRGVISKNALTKAKGIKLEVITGLPMKGKQLKQKAIEMREGITTISNRVKLSKQVLYVKGFESKVYGHKGKIVICSNEKERSLLREIRYDEIENAIKRLKKGRNIKERIKDYIKGGEIDEDAVARAEMIDGLYIIFSTNPSLDAKDIVRAYFQKDKIEKAFKCLKGMIMLRPIRHWLSDRVKAHVFICYLSYALFSVLDWKLKSAKLEISLNNALELLEDLYRVSIRDPKRGNNFVKYSVMSKEQESIFKAVNKDLINGVKM